VPTSSTLSRHKTEESANHCFGCGELNPQGLHLHFALDASNPEAITASTTVRLTKIHQGPPGCVHGGIIATLLDEAMSKVNRAFGVIAMTRNMEVDYLRPVPLEAELTIVGHHVRRDGRKIFNTAEILGQEGKVLAQAKGLFVVVDPALITGRR